MNLPNKLTVLRVLMIPFFLVCFLRPEIPGNYLWAFFLFVAASLTDMLDGYIARKHNLVTDFGKLMDPLADKLLVMSAFVCLLGGQQMRAFGSVRMGSTVFLIIIMSREFIVTALRQLALDKGVVIAADRWGKLKTISQMVWISMTLLYIALPWHNRLPYSLAVVWQKAESALFLLMMILTVCSGLNYVVKNRHLFADA